MNAEITAIVNQKGGVGKSFSCINIGIGLARAGKILYRNNTGTIPDYLLK